MLLSHEAFSPVPAQRSRVKQGLPAGWLLRTRTDADHAGIRLLMRAVYPPPHGSECVWSEGSLHQHLAYFPEGQFVVTDEAGTIRGTSTTHRVSLERALRPHTWSGITGAGTLSTHEPDGEVLYGVNIAVDPSCQGHGIGRELYQARLDLGRSIGCTLFAAGARLPGYHEYADKLSPDAYVAKVVAGTIFDPTLSKQLALGFRVEGVLPGYAYDYQTLGHAALIVMDL